MKESQKRKIICPQCGKKNTWTDENKFRPFCSERCKLVDLGIWAEEKYRVAGEPVNPEPENKDESE